MSVKRNFLTSSYKVHFPFYPGKSSTTAWTLGLSLALSSFFQLSALLASLIANTAGAALSYPNYCKHCSIVEVNYLAMVASLSEWKIPHILRGGCSYILSWIFLSISLAHCSMSNTFLSPLDLAPIIMLPALYLNPFRDAGLSLNFKCHSFYFSTHLGFVLKISNRFLHSWTFLSALVCTISARSFISLKSALILSVRPVTWQSSGIKAISLPVFLSLWISRG